MKRTKNPIIAGFGAPSLNRDGLFKKMNSTVIWFDPSKVFAAWQIKIAVYRLAAVVFRREGKNKRRGGGCLIPLGWHWLSTRFLDSDVSPQTLAWPLILRCDLWFICRDLWIIHCVPSVPTSGLWFFRRGFWILRQAWWTSHQLQRPWTTINAGPAPGTNPWGF